VEHDTVSPSILRSRIETRVTFPATLVVSSARDDDGAARVAVHVARAFAEDGRPTLLVDANPASHEVARELGDEPLPALAVATAPDGDAAGGDPLSAIDRLRERYAAIVIHAAPLVESSTAVRMARGAGGTILAVRLGRRAASYDRDAAELAGPKLIGVVTTHPAHREAREPAAAGVTLASLVAAPQTVR